MNIWAGEVAAAFLPQLEHRHERGAEVDEVLSDEETSHVVSVSHVLSGMGDRRGLRIPEHDEQLLSLLRRYYRPLPRWTRWALAELAGRERLGLVAPHGVIETSGEHLVLVEQEEEGRYEQFWPIPHVYYPASVRERRER